VPAIAINSLTPDNKAEKKDEDDLDFAKIGQSRH
jgi:hypothetical protein